MTRSPTAENTHCIGSYMAYKFMDVVQSHFHKVYFTLYIPRRKLIIYFGNYFGPYDIIGGYS